MTQYKKSAESKQAQGRRRFAFCILPIANIPLFSSTMHCNGANVKSPKVRSQAARLWRSVQAHPEEEGEDHQKVGAQDGVLCLQVEEPGEQRTGDLHEQDLIKTT